MNGFGQNLSKILYVVFGLDIAILIYSVLAGSYPSYLPSGGDPTSYLILYIHVPISWNMYVAFTVSFVASLLYLLKEDVKYDVLAMTSVVIGVVYGVASITTGMLWANEVWGAPWNWDPRQTATLVLFLAYVGYIALRGSISDVDRMRVFSATYGIAAFVTLPISYISAVLFRSLHTQLPGQPLGPEAHILLGVRVIVSFTVYILLQHLYYTKVKNRVESSMEV